MSASDKPGASERLNAARRRAIYRFGLNNISIRRLDLVKNRAVVRDKYDGLRKPEGTGMIKGRARRVIVVKSPDSKIFEEAIFIIRDDFFNRSGVSSEKIVRQAQEVAEAYIRETVENKRRIFSRVPPPLLAAAGAAAAGAAWLAMRLVGV